MLQESISVAVSVNNQEVLERNLLLSPGVFEKGRNQLIVRRRFESASLAYNSALDAADNDIVVFVHQDVYLPSTWLADLKRCLEYLENKGANWGVLGCYGFRKGAEYGLGRVYTRGIGLHGRCISSPEPIETVDEIILVLRKSSGLRFDEGLPHFHFYATDICMTARERGLVNYAFQGFCVHNTNQLMILPEEFYTCYRFVRQKWSHYLPIQTSCIKISAFNQEFYRRRIVEAAQRAFGMSRYGLLRAEDPRQFSIERD
jgi:hypothetical protein